MVKNRHKISVFMAVLNSEKVLGPCLRSIRKQDFPKKDLEIILADGGSTDRTVEIGKKYGAKIVKNPLKTSESGKAVALKYAKGDYLVQIDSDNILPDKNWLKRMIAPFKDKEIVLTEPIKYTYRQKDPWLTRYFAMLGMNDPICLFTGNYDRLSVLTNRWTGLEFTQEDKGDYLKVRLDNEPIPTIGANGTVFRASLLKSVEIGDYLFDIDVLLKLIKKKGHVYIAKVKTGIVHTFVEDNPVKFFKKQLRRINDMSYHRSRKSREIDWEKTFFWKVVYFQLQCLLIFPIVFQTIKGFFKKPDFAWIFHPVACYSTWLIYLYGWVKGKIVPKETSRKNWRQ